MREITLACSHVIYIQQGLSLDLPHSTNSEIHLCSLSAYSVDTTDRGHEALAVPAGGDPQCFRCLPSTARQLLFFPAFWSIGACYHTNNVVKFWMTQKNMGRKRVVSQEKQVVHIEQFDRKTVANKNVCQNIYRHGSWERWEEICTQS